MPESWVVVSTELFSCRNRISIGHSILCMYTLNTPVLTDGQPSNHKEFDQTFHRILMHQLERVYVSLARSTNNYERIY